MAKPILPGTLAYARLPSGKDHVAVVLVIGTAGPRRWLCMEEKLGLLTVAEDDMSDVHEDVPKSGD